MTEYSVDIEARVERWPEDEDEGDAMLSFLEALDALGALGPVAHGRAPEILGARFHVATGDPAEAVTRALGLFWGAAEKVGFVLGQVERIEAVTDERLQRHLEEPAERDPYLGVAEVARMLGVSRQRVSELRGRPGFPEPVAELASGPVWRGWQLRRFLEEWPRRPGRPRADEELLAAARALPSAVRERLTPRVRQVLELVDRGRSLSQIARELGLQRATVRSYLRHAVIIGEDEFDIGEPQKTFYIPPEDPMVPSAEDPVVGSEPVGRREAVQKA